MSEVDRWDMERVDYEDYCMVLSSSGDYVMFEDYEDKLLDAKYDYDQLQKKYDRLIGILGDLYREG